MCPSRSKSFRQKKKTRFKQSSHVFFPNFCFVLSFILHFIKILGQSMGEPLLFDVCPTAQVSLLNSVSITKDTKSITIRELYNNAKESYRKELQEQWDSNSDCLQHKCGCELKFSTFDEAFNHICSCKCTVYFVFFVFLFFFFVFVFRYQGMQV